jgi:hypothetical protein
MGIPHPKGARQKPLVQVVNWPKVDLDAIKVCFSFHQLFLESKVLYVSGDTGSSADASEYPRERLE